MNSVRFKTDVLPFSSSALSLYFFIIENLALQRARHGPWEWHARTDSSGVNTLRLFDQTAVGCFDALGPLFLSAAAEAANGSGAEQKLQLAAPTQPAASSSLRMAEKWCYRSVRWQCLCSAVDSPHHWCPCLDFTLFFFFENRWRLIPFRTLQSHSRVFLLDSLGKDTHFFHISYCLANPKCPHF